MRAHLGGDLSDAIEQARIVERRFGAGDAVPRQLSGLADQPSGVRQRADWNRPILGRHTAERIPRHQRGSGTESRRTNRRYHSGRPASDHEHFDVIRRQTRSRP